MVSKEKTMEILEKFSQECYNFWMRKEGDHFIAFRNMLRDIEEITHDPYEPYGEELDLTAKAEFIKREKER